MGATVVADVIVVGMGCAGAAAAIEAARAGSSVVVLERASGPGGASAMSGGELYLGGGTSLQKACGIDDSAEAMFAYLAAALGPHADEEKLQLYCEGSVEHFEWFRELGVEFRESLFEVPTWLPPTEDGLMWLGENAWPFTEISKPAPRGHRPATPGHGGWLLMDRMNAVVAEAGAEVHVDTRATALIQDGRRIVGVRARHFSDEVTYQARRGVVLTTGGFVDNEEMLADHAPVLTGHGKVSAGLDDGSGIRLGMSVGGSVRRLGSVQIALSVVPALACRGMLVNGLGQRFVNEDVYPGRFSQAAVQRQAGPCFTIVDEQGWEEVPMADRWGVQPTIVTDKLEEIEAELGFPEFSLSDTIARYNEDAERGADLLFHKDSRWLRRLVPPFAAIDARRGFDPRGSGRVDGTGVSGFTLGGLRTSVDGEVLDQAGLAIPGLFAAGRASSGIHGEGYVSGTSLGDGTFFGRRAGRAVSR